MADAQPLLELQRLDSEADALRARRDALPERALLGEREAEMAALESQRNAAKERELALGRDEHRVETQVTDARAKAQEIEATLYSGKIKVVNELKALQAELRSFQQRQREHEEAELAVMEQQEQLATEIAALDARGAALASEAGSLRAALGRRGGGDRRRTRAPRRRPRRRDRPATRRGARQLREVARDASLEGARRGAHRRRDLQRMSWRGADRVCQSLCAAGCGHDHRVSPLRPSHPALKPRTSESSSAP